MKDKRYVSGLPWSNRTIAIVVVGVIVLLWMLRSDSKSTPEDGIIVEIQTSVPNVNVVNVNALATDPVTTTTSPTTPPCYHQCFENEFFRCEQECPTNRLRFPGVHIPLEKLNACNNPYRDNLKSPFNFYAMTRPYGKPATSMACYSRTDLVCGVIAETGTWEQELMHVLNGLNDRIKNKHGVLPTYVDIGANVGAFVWMMAKSGNNVVAFEMMKQNLALIHYTACVNDGIYDSSRVKLYNYGVSDSSGKCAMISQNSNEGDGVLMCNQTKVDYFVSKERYVIRGYVELKTLDEMFPDGFPFPTIIKMDVEGHEPVVVKGGKQSLRGDKRPLAILSEVWRSIDVPAYAEYMRSEYEYDVWWVDRNQELKTREDVVNMHGHVGHIPHNLLFVRRDMRSYVAPP